MELDVAVVGASSAGLYAAEKLAGAGKRVGVFEQMAELAPARRTLIVTPHLSHLLGELPRSVVIHRIHSIELESAEATVRVPLKDPDLIVERKALIHHLAARAQNAGAVIHHNCRFGQIQPDGEGARLCFQTSDKRQVEVDAHAVIGADGVFSDVAKAVGARHAPTVPILQAHVKLPHDWDPGVARVWFDTDATRFFYWLIPESDQHAVVGLVGDERARMRELLLHFLERQGFHPLGFQGARIALYHPRLCPWARVGAVPVLFVGDAAGQVKVTTVGGTVSGLLGAEAAVRALLNHTSYARELKASQRELNLHWGIRGLLEHLDNRGYTQLVRAVTPRVQRFLSEHHRDAFAGQVGGLVAAQPSLMLFALRALRRRRAPRSELTGSPLPFAE